MGMLTWDPRPVVECDPEDGGAQQSFKAECDINNIMKKYVKTGMITHVAQNKGRYADVSEVGSYHEAVQRVRDTRAFFLGLPPAVRAEFDHDAAIFLDFISDPEKEADIRRMGLDPLTEDGPEPVPASEVEPVVEEGSEEA